MQNLYHSTKNLLIDLLLNMLEILFAKIFLDRGEKNLFAILCKLSKLFGNLLKGLFKTWFIHMDFNNLLHIRDYRISLRIKLRQYVFQTFRVFKIIFQNRYFSKVIFN